MVYTIGLGPIIRKDVEVQVLSWAQLSSNIWGFFCGKNVEVRS